MQDSFAKLDQQFKKLSDILINLPSAVFIRWKKAAF